MRPAVISGLAAMVWPNRQRRVNFSHPLNGRHWLKLLLPDRRHGIRFHPNLELDRKELGFSFNSNALGLRGPASSNASQVILGTSFAMGLSVNNGENWYDELLEPEKWFNAAMPVGPLNQIRLLEDVYSGCGSALLYIYHPNIWKTAQAYLTVDRLGRDIFNVMRWKTDHISTYKLIPRWLSKEVTKASTGHSQYMQVDGEPWHFNANYCNLDFEKNHELFEEVSRHFEILFSRFDKVLILRVPIKEELAAERTRSQRLMLLSESYDKFWEAFISRLGTQIETHNLPRSAFDFPDFLPYDTHWSKRGNATFARLASPILRSARLSGINYDA